MISKKLILQIQTALSKEPKIKLSYILGSVISGRVKEDSDFDLTVVVDDQANMEFEQIYNLISHVNFPKNLDLSIIDRNSSPIFLFQIISTGKCLYKRSEKEKILFEAFVAQNYYDNAHLRKIYYSYLKDKFPYAH